MTFLLYFAKDDIFPANMPNIQCKLLNKHKLCNLFIKVHKEKVQEPIKYFYGGL